VYGLLFAATASGLVVGALTNARLSRAGMSHARLMAWGQTLIVGTALLLLALTFADRVTVWLLVGLAVIGFIGHGIVRPNAVQGALEPLPEIAGVASAMLATLQMIVGALSSAIVAEWFDGHSPFAITAMMAITASVSAIVYAAMVRPAERVVSAIPVSLQP
jgi:DHA1 family bicyclomycin/chloramphenicol resistance-like MFS transporter